MDYDLAEAPLGGLFLAWGLIEAGLTIWDVYETGTTLMDPCASLGDKVLSGGSMAMSAGGPGPKSLYEGLGKAGKKLLGAGKKTSRGTTLADDAFEHGYNYHPRIRARGLQDPKAHNFPYSFDDTILREAPIEQADGSLLYRKVGDLNGVGGVYEIAVNPGTGTIFHRTFRRQ